MIFVGVGVPWFPQEYAHLYFVAKGVVALIATLLLIIHMNLTWDHVTHHGTPGQRLRYYTLLAFSVLVSGSTLEQIREDSPVSYRHLAVMFVMIALIIAMVVSIKEDYSRMRRLKGDTGDNTQEET